MPFYKKKPLVIEAKQFTGENWEEIAQFCPRVKSGPDNAIVVLTDVGEVCGVAGDYVVKTEHGDFLLWSRDGFERVYEVSNL